MLIHQPARAIGITGAHEYLLEVDGVRFPHLLIEGTPQPRTDGAFAEDRFVDVTVWMGSSMVGLTLHADQPVVTSDQPEPVVNTTMPGRLGEQLTLREYTEPVPYLPSPVAGAAGTPPEQHAHPEDHR